MEFGPDFAKNHCPEPVATLQASKNRISNLPSTELCLVSKSTRVLKAEIQLLAAPGGWSNRESWPKPKKL